MKCIEGDNKRLLLLLLDLILLLPQRRNAALDGKIIMNDGADTDWEGDECSIHFKGN
jgi:hypothetical protein